MRKKKSIDNDTVSVVQKLKNTFSKKIPLDTLGSYKELFLDNPYAEDIIPTGSVIFDIYLNGGFRPGVSRFVGEPEHGKTANALAWAKNWQDTIENSYVLYINAEGRLTQDLIEKSGVDTSDDRFAVWTHNIYEDITEIISQLIYDNEEGIRYFFVIDSMDALITKDDFDKKMDESKTVAGGARLSSVFLKKVCVRIAFRGHHLMALSQTRMNMNSRAVGQVSMKPSGGKAIEFFTSLTGYIKNIGRSGSSFSKHIHESRNDLKSKPIGHYFTIEFVKTYHERSYEEIGIPIKYGHGVWHEQECLDLCMAYQYITKSGAWYEFSEDIIKLVEDKGEEMVAKHQGEQKVIDFLENNPKITWIILDFIKDLCISSNKALSKLIIEDDSDVSSSKAD